MAIIQRSGGRSIMIKDGKVNVDGQEVSAEEAERVKQEGLARLSQAMRTAKPSPGKGDTVVVVKGTNVHISGKGVTLRRK